MRICFVVSEIFGWGTYGGFGKLTSDIAIGLAKKGIEVFVLVRKGKNEKSKGQRIIETREGIIIIGLPHGYFQRLRSRYFYTLPEADIYHSEAPTFDSWLTMKFNPNSKHLITFQDPRDFNEYWKPYSLDPRYNTFFNKYNLMWRWKILDFFRRKAIKNADALYCQARFIIPLVKKMYNLEKEPEFLPNPVKIPKRKLKKADEPTVCFLARWDLQKRPEMFFELAKKFPEVKFIAMGKAHDKERDRYLRKKYGKIPNLIMTGFVSEEEKSKILEKSWVMINTSIRECLPLAFLEACAHKCAILSAANPDNFASNFGFWVKNDNFEEGLNFLLDKKWKKLGKKGYKYVKKVHEYEKVIERHIKVYETYS